MRFEVSPNTIDESFDAGIFDEEDEQEFGPITPGWYTTRITDFEVREGKRAPYINWEFQIVQTEDDPFHMRRVWCITSLAPQALFRFKNLVQASGYQWDREQTLSEQLPALIGLFVDVKVENEEYAGELRNRITRFSKPSDPTAVAVTDEDIPF